MKIIFIQFLSIYFFTFAAFTKQISASEHHAKEEDFSNQLSSEKVEKNLDRIANEIPEREEFRKKEHNEKKHNDHEDYGDKDRHSENEAEKKEDNNDSQINDLNNKQEQLDKREVKKHNHKYNTQDIVDTSENSHENIETEQKHSLHKIEREESPEKNIHDQQTDSDTTPLHLANTNENHHETDKEVIKSGGSVVSYSYKENKNTDGNEYQSIKTATYKNDSINIIQTAVINSNTGNNSISDNGGSAGGAIETGGISTNVGFNADFSHDVITYITPSTSTEYVYISYPVTVYRDYIYTTPTQTYNNYTYPTLNRIYYPTLQTTNTYKTTGCPECPASSANQVISPPVSSRSTTANTSGFGEILLLGALGGFSIPKVVSKIKLLSNYRNS